MHLSGDATHHADCRVTYLPKGSDIAQGDKAPEQEELVD